MGEGELIQAMNEHGNTATSVHSPSDFMSDFIVELKPLLLDLSLGRSNSFL